MPYPIRSILIRALLAGFLLSFIGPRLWAQPSAPPMRTSLFPADSPSQFLDYNASGKTSYICYASPAAATSSFSLGAGLTNIVVSSNVATLTTTANHGLVQGYTITVSGSATSALNGTYRLITATGTTGTFNTAGVGDATYTDATISTTAPLLTNPIWSIQSLQYDASSGNLISVQWANGSSTRYNSICANRAVDHGATVISYK